MAFFLLCTAIFILFFQPVFLFPGLTPYSPVRYSALLALIVYFLFGEKSEIDFFAVKENKYFFLFITFQVASAGTIWAYAAAETFYAWLCIGIIYFLIIKSCINEKRIKYIILGIVTAIIYLSYFSIKNFVMVYEPGLQAGGYGWYTNANDLAAILVPIIPLTFALGETAKSIFSKYFFYLMSFIFVFNLLFTASRNALLGLLTVGGLCMCCSRKISRLFRISLSILLIACVITVGVANVLSRSDLSSSGLSGDASSENRLEQWNACFRMIKDHPFFGVGPNNARYEMRSYGGIPGLPPHNTLVQVFAETGIPGGIFFFLFTFYPLLSAYKFLKSIKFGEGTQAIILYKYLIIALIGFWVCAFFTNRVEFYILYVLVALIVSTREVLLKNVEQ